MVNVTPSSHDHLEGGYDFTTRGTVTRVAEQPEIVPLAQDQVRLGVQGGADLPQSAVAASAFEAVFMPVEVEGLQEVALGDGLAAAGALLGTTPGSGFGCLVLRHVHRHHWGGRP